VLVPSRRLQMYCSLINRVPGRNPVILTPRR
jgi:hypothetical protein